MRKEHLCLRTLLHHIYAYERYFNLRSFTSIHSSVVTSLLPPGRWWDKKGVDSPQFILTTLLGVYFFGILDTFDWAKYSITSYDIMCRWPWQLFLFTSFIILLASFLTCLHVIKAYHDKILLGRLSEIFLCVCVFILPIATDSSTHYHHWFTAWFIGQHANQKYWWSISCSALLWGGYINGIASWGR